MEVSRIVEVGGQYLVVFGSLLHREYVVMSACTCLGPGYCPRFKQEMLGRLYELCSEKCPESRPCDAVVSEAFRDVMEAYAQGQPSPEPKPRVERKRCEHLLEMLGELRVCNSCCGHVEIKLVRCYIYGKCTTHKRVDGVACCATCPDYKERV